MRRPPRRAGARSLRLGPPRHSEGIIRASTAVLETKARAAAAQSSRHSRGVPCSSWGAPNLLASAGAGSKVAAWQVTDSAAIAAAQFRALKPLPAVPSLPFAEPEPGCAPLVSLCQAARPKTISFSMARQASTSGPHKEAVSALAASVQASAWPVRGAKSSAPEAWETAGFAEGQSLPQLLDHGRAQRRGHAARASGRCRSALAVGARGLDGHI